MGDRAAHAGGASVGERAPFCFATAARFPPALPFGSVRHVTSPSPVPVEAAAPTVRAVPRLPLLRRIVFVLSGFTMLVGFFLPWLKVGSLLTVSGFALVFAEGDVVQTVSGSHRFLLIVVPLLGATLFGTGLAGVRATPWIATLGSGAILAFGLVQVIELLLSSTGLGMWLVILAAVLCLIVGLLGVGRAER